jgi:tripartite-type tricarboxylate transporter receptor subunit TctC
LPRDVLVKLSTDIIAVTQLPDVRARFAGMGVESIGTTSAQLATIMQAEQDKWTRLIRAANIKPD